MNINYAKQRLEIAGNIAGHVYACFYESASSLHIEEGVDVDEVANKSLQIADAIIGNWQSDLLQTIDSMPDNQKNSIAFINLMRTLGLGE